MRRNRYLYPLIFLGLLMWPRAALAQTSATNINYKFGWNMVSGPTGTSFFSAESMFAFRDGAYVVKTDMKAQDCVGYWAYFSAPSPVQLAQQTPSTSVTCNLQAGWNMVGDPFKVAVALPADLTAYSWNPDGQRYDLVKTIPAGGSVWIYSAPHGSLIFQYKPAPSNNVVVTPPTGTVYQLHVGDTITVVMPVGGLSYTATADPAYLRLESVDTSAQGRTWVFRAVAPGRTAIDIEPSCRQSTPPCEIVGFGVQVVITSQ